MRSIFTLVQYKKKQERQMIVHQLSTSSRKMNVHIIREWIFSVLCTFCRYNKFYFSLIFLSLKMTCPSMKKVRKNVTWFGLYTTRAQLFEINYIIS